MTCAAGSLAKLLVKEGTGGVTHGADSTPVPFLYETIQKKGKIVGAKGITGSREELVTQTRVGSYMIGGQLAFYATPLKMDTFLPWILGADEVATDSFKTAESLQTFSVLADKVGDIFQYDDCVVNRGIIRAKAGPATSEQELVECVVDIMGKTENQAASWPGSPPSYSTAATNVPYILSDAVVTVNGNAISILNLILMVDNHVQPRWVNSVFPTELCPNGRTILLRVEAPFDAAHAGYLYTPTAATRQAGVAATLVFTNGARVLTFTFTGLQWANETAVVKGKRPIPQYVDFIARSKGAASQDALIVTNTTA